MQPNQIDVAAEPGSAEPRLPGQTGHAGVGLSEFAGSEFAGSEFGRTGFGEGGDGLPGPRSGTYVGDTFQGDIAMTMGGTHALAADGEFAGLARVTMAMHSQVRRDTPATPRIVALCLWAAALAVFGFVLGIRAVVGLIAGAPHWFGPTFALLGVVGVALTMSAFVAVRIRVVPWFLLGLATCTLGAAIAATLAAF